MALPRITGLLHNCALNSALPTLLEGIEKLAIHEANGTLDTVAEHMIVQNYLKLKNTFAKHYGLEGDVAFTWGEFHAFLNKHSFYANEIIFAPVFRNFIVQEGSASGLYQQRGLLQPDGVYNDLAAIEVASLFHNRFGISLKSYEYIGDYETGNPEDNYALMDDCITPYLNYPFGETPTLNVYLKDLHFEIQPHESLAESNSEFVAEVSNLPQPLAAIHNGLNFSESDRQSNKCLNDLVHYVHTDLMAQLVSARQRISERQLISARQHNKLDLREHQDRFIDLLADLDLITRRLREKEKTTYAKVLKTAESLHGDLKREGDEFFNNPTPHAFASFKRKCNTLIQDAEHEFNTHRGNPLINALMIVIKGLLGVLAALTVIPALIIEKKSRHGYVKTFFSLETESAKQLAEVKDDFNVLEQELAPLINPGH